MDKLIDLMNDYLHVTFFFFSTLVVNLRAGKFDEWPRLRDIYTTFRPIIKMSNRLSRINFFLEIYNHAPMFHQCLTSVLPQFLQSRVLHKIH